MGCHAVRERANGVAGQPHESKSVCRALSLEARTQIRGGGEDVSAVRQGERAEPGGARGGQDAIRGGQKKGTGHETFIYVNNRLEGNALETIDAMREIEAN